MPSEPEGTEVSTRILVVDDDANVRFTVRAALESAASAHGELIELVEATGGNAALTCLVGDTFDVVVLDAMMPDLDGMAVLGRLRADSGDGVPVVMLTAKGRESDVANAFRAGADAYLTKPFDVEELVTVTRTMSRLSTLQRRRRRAEELQRAELLLQLEQSFGDSLS